MADTPHRSLDWDTPHSASGGRPSETFIGIDLGSTFIKGGLLDLEHMRVTAVRRAPFPPPVAGLPPNRWEVDPRQVVDAVRGLLDALAAAGGSVGGVVMCSQMHGLVLTTATGEPRSNVTTWQDRRPLEDHPAGHGSYFDTLARRIGPQQLQQMGNELRPDQPVARLFWMAEQGLLPDRTLYLASLPDFVAANLCGTAPCTDLTNAAAHGALNLASGDWHWGMLAGLGLDGLQWPAIRPHGAVVGSFHLGGRAVPCYVAVGDSQAALLGALLDEDELSLNVATGAQVSLLRPHLVHGDFNTRPYFDGRWLATIPNVPAGRSLTALVRLLTALATEQGVTLADPWPAIARSAAAVEPTRLRVDLAFFDSDCGNQGAITGIREEELTIGHLFRASFQNMVDNFYASALRLSPERGWRRLVFSGGLVQRIPLLRTLICDRFGVEARLSPTEEDTMLGLLALALVCAGRVPSVAAATATLRQVYAVAPAAG